MKKIYSFSLAAIAALALAVSCSKEETSAPEKDIDAPVEQEEPGNPAQTGPVTLRLVLPNTRVTFTPDVDGSSKPILKLGWEDGDKVRVYNAADHSVYEDFNIAVGSISGTNNEEAIFAGTAPAGSSFDIEVLDASGFGTTATQAQISDGNTTHLKFLASATGISTLTDETPIVLDGSSSVLGLTAKLPADSTATINSVVLEASEAIFPGGNTLTINLGTQEDDGDDDILRVYANVNAGTIPAGTTLFVKFTSTTRVYTRYYEFAAAKSILAGKYNDLTLNCSQTDKHAGAPAVCDGTTSAKAYLIANGYQLAAINSYASTSATTYIKMIDNVDMSGITHVPVNTGLGGSGYPIVVNFNGNNKTISNLGKSLFYVFKGSIENLTLSSCSVGTSRGIFAEYCQGTGHSITNVDITGGSMATSSANGGAMIGRINNGSETTLTITDCDVTNTTVSGAAQTGGLIGSADANVVVDNCSVVKADAGTSSVTASGSNCGGLIGQTTGTVTITDCTVSGTNVTGTGVVGGVVGFANSLVTVSGSKYTGGTVQASNRYCGGFVGSTADVASAITDCQVEDATVTTTYNDDSRCGGFVGQLQTSCQVKGCTVGTNAKKVTVNTPNPASNKVLNSGGFVGVNYGTITKNEDVRTKAYAKITSANTQGQPLDLGGFVGFGRGTIEYCDAIVDMTSLKGQYIGGFAGYVVNAGTVIDNCTVDGPVTGNNYTGGFAGYVDSGAPVISNCTASGSVTAQSGCGGFVGQTMTGVFTNCSTSATCSFNGSNNGGFAGQIHGGTLTGCSESGSVTNTSTGTTFGGFVGLIHDSCTLDKCSATGNVSANSKSYFGGFIGAINNGSTILIKRCWATGNVTSDQTYASAFIGNINQGTEMTLGSVTIENCYATGNIINSNQMRGGLIAAILSGGPVTVSNCYTTGAVVGSIRLGGLIGNIAIANVTVEHCAAWNSGVTASSIGNGNWSSGAIVGTAFPSCTLTDNYRKVDMPVKAFWGNVSGYTWELTSDYNHPNVDGSDSSTYLVVRDKTTGVFGVSTTATLSGGNYPIFPYHGKVEAGKTLSQLASTTLGWSSVIWDFSGELPTLR